MQKHEEDSSDENDPEIDSCLLSKLSEIVVIVIVFLFNL